MASLRPALDPRLNAFRDDLAADALKGQVEASRFVSGRPAHVTVPVTALRRRPEADGPRDTELLRGESVSVFDEADGFAWVQSQRDAYVGYVSLDALGTGTPAPTHRVSALRSFIYGEADLKSPMNNWVSLNSPLVVSGTQGRFSALAGGGYVFSDHLLAMDVFAPDYVSIAEQFLETPYLWGGRSSLGLDCSGLVQCALEATGIPCPRDTDMQEAALGSAMPDSEPLQRGDLLFWKGHVGIMADGATLLHANATHMKTVEEAVEPAIARIAQTDGPVTSVKRLPALSR
ncbi:NLP/P60 family lipoprotein [Candidatus Phaeomarinobacter ectocarpi]|uniref:NLP/P60 family lipoprotein n=1 Tax=Candidatus Phaeomarinibacter ectocarpi TaxID=1458461 RepID=X5MLY2_9HYPH|nr:C40 family peptidase [Candidatus Phaeomarinobacter ectocarpi]CDO59900.1 NLP/P60 family lipoprotein [Candidatus Phaeomarinobacter ectocarpi]